MNGYTCYLPANLNVDTLLGECPPRGIENFNKDKLIYTFGLVNLITANNKDIEIPNGFVPLNAHTLQNSIRNYSQYLDAEDIRYIDEICNDKLSVSAIELLKKAIPA